MRILATALAVTGLSLWATACGGQDPDSASSDTPPVSLPAPPGADPAGAAERAAAGESSVVSRCLDLARREEWASALTPCTLAAQQAPDNFDVEHALHQAQASAANAAAEARGVAAQSAEDAAARESSKLIDKSLGQ